MSQNFSCLQARISPIYTDGFSPPLKIWKGDFNKCPFMMLREKIIPTLVYVWRDGIVNGENSTRCSICQIRRWCILRLLPSLFGEYGKEEVYPDRCFMWGYLRSWSQCLTTQNAGDPNAGFFRYVIYLLWEVLLKLSVSKEHFYVQFSLAFWFKLL